eukprot:1098595-Pleurochrysis_carterae.AAC.7
MSRTDKQRAENGLRADDAPPRAMAAAQRVDVPDTLAYLPTRLRFPRNSSSSAQRVDSRSIAAPRGEEAEREDVRSMAEEEASRGQEDDVRDENERIMRELQKMGAGAIGVCLLLSDSNCHMPQWLLHPSWQQRALVRRLGGVPKREVACLSLFQLKANGLNKVSLPGQGWNCGMLHSLSGRDSENIADEHWSYADQPVVINVCHSHLLQSELRALSLELDATCAC